LPAVSDTSPLIWLAKVGKISLLKELFQEIIIPQDVYAEAVENGLKHGYSDVLIISECIQQGWIKPTKIDPKDNSLIQRISEHAFELHSGEIQAIVIAQQTNMLLLMDESSGRTFAEAWGLKVKGTIYVVMSALRAGLIDKTQAKETILKMITIGFRLEPKLLAQLITEIEKQPSHTKNT
jgi:uncharacterized protein